MKCPHGRRVIDECDRKVYTGTANACQVCIDESRRAMKTPRPCYSCASDNLSLLFPNRWHDFAVVCLGCGEFGASAASADAAIEDWDARCERELREQARTSEVRT